MHNQDCDFDCWEWCSCIGGDPHNPARIASSQQQGAVSNKAQDASGLADTGMSQRAHDLLRALIVWRTMKLFRPKESSSR